MRIHFALPVQDWECELTDAGLQLFGGSKLYGPLTIPWTEIVEAGVSPRKEIRTPKGAPLGEIFPMGDKLGNVAVQLSRETDYFYVVYRQGRRRRIRTLPLPKTGPQHDSFVAEMRQRLATRWNAQAEGLLALRKRLGFSNLWVGPMGCLIVLIVAAVIFGFLALKSTIPPLLGFAAILVIWAYQRWVKPRL